MIKINRRAYLATATATISGAGLAGCSSSTDSGEPAYDSSQAEEMLLSVDAFPDGWKRKDELNTDFDRVFISGNQSRAVLLKIDILEKVGKAKENFQASKSEYSDPQNIDIGKEAFWDTQNEEIAYTIFRDSNAIGQVAALQISGAGSKPDKQKSQKYAREMYRHWQAL